MVDRDQTIVEVVATEASAIEAATVRFQTKDPAALQVKVTPLFYSHGFQTLMMSKQISYSLLLFYMCVLEKYKANCWMIVGIVDLKVIPLTPLFKKPMAPSNRS